MHYGRTLWDLSDFELDYYPVWVRTPLHTEPVLTPLYVEMFCGYMFNNWRIVSDFLKTPYSMGPIWKMYKGHGYASIALPREEEIPEREAQFKKNMEPVFRDVDKFVEESHKRIDDLTKPFLPMVPDEMDDGQLISHVYEMLDFQNRAIYQFWLGWNTLSPWVSNFQDLILEVAGIRPSDAEYSHLLAGFSNILQESNTQLRKLAQSAIEDNLGDIFLNRSPEEVIPAMQESESGKHWVARFNDFIAVHGFRTMRHYEFCEPGWYEDPTLVMPVLRQYVEAGGGRDLEKERAQRVKEREEAESKLMSQVPQERKHEATQLLKLARAANYWLEGADYLCDMRRMAIGRRCFMACGKRLTSDGVIGSPEDIWMLFPDEILDALGKHEKGRYIPVVEDRRKEWEYYKSLTTNTDEVPLFFGDPNQIMEMLSKDMGIAPTITPPALEDPDEVGALLTGGAGAPGVVEGTARVVMDESGWNDVKPGEIMVCPMTSATWTPLFGIIGGLITDSGGELSHPVIVSREYGIPAVCGTVSGTQKLKTGDKVKVDANKLRVYKLD